MINERKRLNRRFSAKLPITIETIASSRKRVLLVETKNIYSTGVFAYTKEAFYISDDTQFIIDSFYPKKSTTKLKKLKTENR